MTRNEFLEDVNDWESLIDFAAEIECDVCDDLVLGESLSGRVSDDFNDYAYDYDWTDIRRWLMDIREGYDCYNREGSFEYSALDDEDFDGYKSDVLSFADRYNYWDEEEDPDDEEEDEDYDVEEDEEDAYEEDDYEVPEEEFSVSDLFGFCTEKITTIALEEEAERKAEDEAFESFFCSC